MLSKVFRSTCIILATLFFALMAMDMLILPLLISVSRQAQHVEWIPLIKVMVGGVAITTLIMMALTFVAAHTIMYWKRVTKHA